MNEKEKRGKSGEARPFRNKAFWVQMGYDLALFPIGAGLFTDLTPGSSEYKVLYGGTFLILGVTAATRDLLAERRRRLVENVLKKG